MDALVGADRNLARGGDLAHAGEVVGHDRLFEKIEPGPGDRPHEFNRLLAC